MSPTADPPPAEELRAVLRLLDDESPRVARAARDRLVELLELASDPLDADLLDGATPEARVVVREVRAERRGRALAKDLRRALAGDRPLEDGAFVLARLGDRDLEPAPYRERLDEWADRVRPRVEGLAPAAALRVLGEVLGGPPPEGLGLEGNAREYYEPENSFLHEVMKRRTGIPITLSILYILVGERVGVPVEGVGMPGHFVVRAADGGARDDRIAYLDPFHGGRSVTRADLARFLVRAGYGFRPAYLAPVPPVEILRRMVRNLTLIYTRAKDGPAIRLLEALADGFAE